MKPFFTVFLILLYVHSIAGLNCSGPHEYEYEFTPVCPLECGTVHLMRCVAKTATPSCQCKDGTVRDTKHNKCVNLNECPNYYATDPLVCEGENEQYAEQVSACPPTCQHPVGPLCMAIIHKPSCVCAMGTIRDTVSGKCVTRDNCPKIAEPQNNSETPLVCNGENEIYKEYESACPPTCERPESLCAAIVHKPSCVCTSGTVRDTVSKKCVALDQCPKITDQKPLEFLSADKLVCDGVNEEYSELSAACPYTCENRHVEHCPMVFNKPSCICKKETIRDTISGNCIDPNKCPIID